jgi:hypothetical protein
MVKKPFLKRTLRNVTAQLALLSFSVDRGAFVTEIEKGVLGWVALNISGHLPRGRVGISPMVGIRYSRIEERLEELVTDWIPSGATVSTPIGYLSSEGRFLEWVFDPEFDNDTEIFRMVSAVRQYGLPFMKAHHTLASIVNALEQNQFTNKDMRRYRLPVAYQLEGKDDEARTFIDEQLEDLRARTDAAAVQYKDFAKAFRHASA